MMKLNDEDRAIARYSILGGGLIATAWLYKKFGLLNLMVPEEKTKTLKDVFEELFDDIKTRSVFYDTQLSVVDEKSVDGISVNERSKLFYYGFPYDFPEPQTTTIEKKEEVKHPDDFWGAVVDLSHLAVEQAKGMQKVDTVLSIVMKKAINMNSDIDQKIPTADMMSFLQGEYYKYKERIILGYGSGMKLRIPHQPLLSALPLIVDLFDKKGYSTYINESATLYRIISYQAIMMRDAPKDPISGNEVPVIINGINIETGKTVVEEPPPDNAVVIPTSGPYKGEIIPVRETAIM